MSTIHMYMSSRYNEGKTPLEGSFFWLIHLAHVKMNLRSNHYHLYGKPFDQSPKYQPI